MNRNVVMRVERPGPEHHVLVIEDEPQMRAMLTDNLEFEGYRVTSVESGEEALHECSYQAFALLIVDVMLPGMTGFELCERLRARGARSPIIMLTALTHEPDRIRGLELGADDYVSKPFSVRELLARVKAQVRRDDWHSSTGQEFTFGDVTVNVRQRLVTRQRTPHRAVSARVRAAALSARASQRGGEPRTAAARRVGLQPVLRHPHGGQLHCQAAHAARAAPARSPLHHYGARQRVSVAGVGQEGQEGQEGGEGQGGGEGRKSVRGRAGGSNKFAQNTPV